MKSRIWISLPLAAMMMVPAVAQQNSPSQSNTQQPTTTTQTQQTSTESQAQQTTNGHQPLQVETREGFWGKLNPFARQKYVQRQLSPVADRVNELDELTQQNAKNISDVDSRAQAGIKNAMAKATEANNNAVQAGTQAQAAQQTATEANNRLQTVQQVVTNIDQYKPVTQVEIRFRSGQSALSAKAKEALDDLGGQLKDQRGFVVQVQGFAPGGATASLENSQRMADAVARYLVVNYSLPLYRVRVLGVGNIPAPQGASAEEKRQARTPRVEVSLLKNDLEQLSQAQPLSAAPAAQTTAQQQ